MDLSFHRRRKAQLSAGTPDLASLLSGVAARQAMSPTARAQAALDGEARADADPRIDLFAPRPREADTVHAPASFSACALPPLNSRQPN